MWNEIIIELTIDVVLRTRRLGGGHDAVILDGITVRSTNVQLSRLGMRKYGFKKKLKSSYLVRGRDISS